MDLATSLFIVLSLIIELWIIAICTIVKPRPVSQFILKVQRALTSTSNDDNKLFGDIKKGITVPYTAFARIMIEETNLHTGMYDYLIRFFISSTTTMLSFLIISLNFHIGLSFTPVIFVSIIISLITVIKYDFRHSDRPKDFDDFQNVVFLTYIAENFHLDSKRKINTIIHKMQATQKELSKEFTAKKTNNRTFLQWILGFLIIYFLIPPIQHQVTLAGGLQNFLVKVFQTIVAFLKTTNALTTVTGFILIYFYTRFIHKVALLPLKKYYRQQNELRTAIRLLEIYRNSKY